MGISAFYEQRSQSLLLNPSGLTKETFPATQRASLFALCYQTFSQLYLQAKQKIRRTMEAVGEVHNSGTDLACHLLLVNDWKAFSQLTLLTTTRSNAIVCSVRVLNASSRDLRKK